MKHYINLISLLCVITNFCSDHPTVPIILRFSDEPGTYHIKIEPAIKVNQKTNTYTPLFTTTMPYNQIDGVEFVHTIDLPAHAEYVRISIRKYKEQKCIGGGFIFFDAEKIRNKTLNFKNSKTYRLGIALEYQFKHLAMGSKNFEPKISADSIYIQ